MAETLTIESLPPTQRALYAKYDVRAEYKAMREQNIWPQSAAPFSHINMMTTNYDAVLSAAIALGANVAVGLFNVRSSDAAFAYGKKKESAYQPTFKGRITGPVSNLLAIFDRWQLPDKDAMLLLGAESVAYINDLRVGTAGLTTRDMQDRAILLLKIYEGVHSLLREPAAERSWIDSMLPAFGNRTILDTMRGGSIADLILVRAFVDHANGR